MARRKRVLKGSAEMRNMFPLQAARKRALYRDVLFIDPGLGGTGWALFPLVDTMAEVPRCPDEWGVFRPSKRARWLSKVGEAASWLQGFLSAKAVQRVVIEFPELWGGSAVSHASATSKAGGDSASALFKLVYLVGSLGEIARSRGRGHPLLPTPREWKGQLSKEAVISRILRAEPYLRAEHLADHAADAVGMGIAAQGAL